MTPKDPKLSGWLPDFRPADEQLDRHAARLRSLVGQRVANAWTVWNLELDEWFADLPVLLQFDSGLQLEVCWEKFDDLSLTWNTADVCIAPKAWVEWPLEWRPQAHAVLASAVGMTVEGVRATTFRFVTQAFDHAHDVRSAWLTTGIWLGGTARGVHIFNALDENGLSAPLPERDSSYDWRVV